MFGGSGYVFCTRYILWNDKKVMSVVHCKREPYDVYIGRGSKWGNPFRIGEDGDRQEVIDKYEQWIKTQLQLMAALPELHGKVLGC